MNVLHVLMSGSVGGIEKLCKDFYDLTSNHYFFFIKGTGAIYESMKQDEKRVFNLYGDSKLNLFSLFEVKRMLLKICKEKQINSIIFHHGGIFMWECATCLARKKLNVFVYCHADINELLSFESKKFKDKIVILRYRQMIKKIKGVFCISQFVLDGMKQRFPSYIDKLILNYNGIRLENYHSQMSNNTPLKLVFVGRLIKEKGVQNILNFLGHTNFDKVSLDIIGDGPYMTELQKISENLHINGSVTFLGQRKDVNKLLSGYNVFIHLPEMQEGFGLTVIEALSSGLICVVNEKGALPELISDQFNGFVVQSQNEFDNCLKKIVSMTSDQLILLKTNCIESAKKYDVLNTIKCIEHYL